MNTLRVQNVSILLSEKWNSYLEKYMGITNINLPHRLCNNQRRAPYQRFAYQNH